MSETILTIGGRLGDSSAVECDVIDSLTFTDASSSMGSWSATLPFTASLADHVFEDIYIYYDGVAIFSGSLESFDADYESGTTSIDGRGFLVDLDDDVVSVSYTDTTVYEAIQSLLDGTPFDYNLTQHSVGIDKDYSSGSQLTKLFEYGGLVWDSGIQYDYEEVVDQGQVSAIVGDHLRLGDETTSDSDVVLDPIYVYDDSYDGPIQPEMDVEQYPTFKMVNPVDTISVTVTTAEDVPELRLKLKQFDEDAVDAGTILEESWQKDTTGKTSHTFEFTFANKRRFYRPALQMYGDGEVIVDNINIYASNPEKSVPIDSLEITDTKYEILRKLHEIGSYTFTVGDYDTQVIDSFPAGTVEDHQQWTIQSSTRSIDYTNYANSVTVHGKTLDDGTRHTATETNEKEIADLASRGVPNDGVVEAFEKNPDVKTQAEVDSRAEFFLEESVDEKSESGSLEIAPQPVSPGYAYPVTRWGDGFSGGFYIGSSAVYADGESHAEYFCRDFPDHRNSAGNDVLFEVLLHPDGLTALGDNEYQTVTAYQSRDFSGDGKAGGVRIYGDGSVEIGPEKTSPSDETTVGDGAKTSRTQPGLIQDGQTQRLSVRFGTSYNRAIYVNGVKHDIPDDDYTSIDTTGLHEARWWVACDRLEANNYSGGLDDVRLYMAEPRDGSAVQDSLIAERRYMNLEDNDETFTVYNTTESSLLAYLTFDTNSSGMQITDSAQYDTPVNNYGLEFVGTYGTIDEVEYSLNGDTMSLEFDVSGRIDAELIETQRESKSNQRNL